MTKIDFGWFFTAILFPALKPEVDVWTAAVKAQEPGLVEKFDALIGAGETASEGVVDTFLSNIKPGGVLGEAWSLLEPKLAPELANELSALGGLATSNGQAIFDTLYAKLVAWEQKEGL